jgi:hypothetical protein
MKKYNDQFRRIVASTFAEGIFDEDDGDYEGLVEMHHDANTIPDIKLATDTFVSMIGGKYDFYGMDHNAVKLNDMIFEILEDPDDGYRSFLGAVRIADKDSNYTFFRTPIAKVEIKSIDVTELDHFQGYHFIGIKDNHKWGEIGTMYIDDYYPSFVFNYSPKKVAFK